MGCLSKRWRQTCQLTVLDGVLSEPGQLETNTGLLCLSGHGAYLPSTSTHTAFQGLQITLLVCLQLPSPLKKQNRKS